MDGYPKVRRVIVNLCEACIRGEGEMCHTPACVLCRHRVDIPIMEELLEPAPPTPPAPDAVSREEMRRVLEYRDLMIVKLSQEVEALRRLCPFCAGMRDASAVNCLSCKPTVGPPAPDAVETLRRVLDEYTWSEFGDLQDWRETIVNAFAAALAASRAPGGR